MILSRGSRKTIWRFFMCEISFQVITISQKSIKLVCEDHNICEKELSVELKVFSEMCMEQNMSSNFESWLGNFMQLQLLDSFPNMTGIYKIFLTVLMSSASSERLFSILRRLSTYSRSRMGQERFRSLAVLAIERSDSIDISQIIDVFDSEAKQCGRLQLIDFTSNLFWTDM